MSNYVIVFVCSFLLSCNTNNDSANKSSSIEDTSIPVLLEKDSVAIVSDTILPSNIFCEFVSYVDSVGYISDTIRAKKVSYHVLQKVNIKHYCNGTFYRLDNENFGIVFKEKYDLNKDINYKVFDKIMHAFGYYYREDKEGSLIEDGVIEEWFFSNENDAINAIQELNKIKQMVYFNTRSFTIQHKNYLYVFHTRASAFDPTLEKLYNKFCLRLAKI